ncbi:MAG: hypothetical protein EXR72_06400 [Myxococcales bacterium]|nr:hypothetical protein [Myxococcales bacterium]
MNTLLRTALLSSLCALPLAGTVRAETIAEPSTGHGFESPRSIDGKPYTLVGTGVRKKFIIKVYAMAIYVEDAGARKGFAAGRGDAQGFVMAGQFGKLGVLHFARSVDSSKIRDAFREGLEDELSDRAPADVRQAAEGFIAAFDRDMTEGQEIHIRTTGDGKIEASIAGQKRALGQNPKVARAIWGIWLGAKPISTDMRKTLVDRLDALGR